MILMVKDLDYSAISRVASHALRHEPWLYELELDDGGWVSVEQLLIALRGEKLEWLTLSEQDLIDMIGRSDKRRHELSDGKIRALYGHSLPDRLMRQPAVPPALLYHGTSPNAVEYIRQEGLRPMARQYVHLSIDAAMAEQVGKRKAEIPVIMVVDALQAYESGVVFYRGNDSVWLADAVPPAFVK